MDMRTGKVSQAVLDRSVLRPLKLASVSDKKSAVYGEDCALCQEENESGHRAVASVCGTVGGALDRTAEMILNTVRNNLATVGAEAKWMEITVLFPESWEEAWLKQLMERIGTWCETWKITVCGGHTEVSDAIVRPVLSVTAWGNAKEGVQRTAGLQPDQDLVMAGYAGAAGSAILAKNWEEELRNRYPFSILDGARSLEDQDMILEAAWAGTEFYVSAMHDVSQGGVFGALWELAECAGVGLEIDLKRIPIRQETIEICEFFGLNPYQLYGQGALLMGTPRGEALAEHLRMRGIPAAVIGQTISGKERMIRNGEEIRYLDRPAQDALWTMKSKKL